MVEKENKPSILIISGPTASGKSSIAEQLAIDYNLPIINADSRQIYRSMNIGTAKPPPTILQKIDYHLIDILDITERYSAGQFCRDTGDLLKNKLSHHPIIIICGGSDFYIQALINGLAETPAISETIKEKWKKDYKTKGINFLQDQLQELDAAYYQKIDTQNPHRLLRALMVIDQTQKSLSEFETSPSILDDYNVGHFAVHRDRPELYERINSRVDQMIDQGLINEVLQLLPFQHTVALDTVGYREILDYFDGQYDLLYAIDKIKQHSRNYAKRQLTWLRKNPNLQAINPNDIQMLRNWVEDKLQ
ncbi:tRNA (adenosine(37)-N6)-dimethylallyltransferase MiaA [Membranihabitans marinus]|uniref:tRNA (adenosine(37)-N6)-dimethylallyltransferase MiaA n=1 Tax=Membranihabitans marinus TaxID=1227546 RepID=UPI001F013FD7|nr:tRNA (adenosine(37)-N6)-dimethylallyltransferase MiaA [Membranihabitans marinus]